jgi:hypothetical protein
MWSKSYSSDLCRVTVRSVATELREEIRETVEKVLASCGLEFTDDSQENTHRPETPSDIPEVLLKIADEQGDVRGRIPAGAQKVMPPGQTLDVLQAGKVVYLVAGGLLCELNLSTSEAAIHVYPLILAKREKDIKVLPKALVLTLLVLLREHCLFSIHAAAVLCRGRGLLIAADSDSGKSTLTYSLVRQGWKYLSDDFLLLHDTGSGVEAFPFRRSFGLDAEAGRFFPELNREWEMVSNEEAKWVVSVEALFPSQFVSQCMPRVIVFPEIVQADVSEIEEVAPVQAMHKLLRQSGFLDVTSGASQQQVSMFGRLVNQARSYRLWSGRDLIRDPLRASRLLGALLDEVK